MPRRAGTDCHLDTERTKENNESQANDTGVVHVHSAVCFSGKLRRVSALFVYLKVGQVSTAHVSLVMPTSLCPVPIHQRAQRLVVRANFLTKEPTARGAASASRAELLAQARA